MAQVGGNARDQLFTGGAGEGRRFSGPARPDGDLVGTKLFLIWLPGGGGTIPELPPGTGSVPRRWNCSGKERAAPPNTKQGIPVFWRANIHLYREDAEPLLLISVRLCMKRRIIQESGIVPGSGKQ
ncbi:MAG: hypothetical protein CMP31_04910 [Roseibacillus sp.]|jgi:hypothetical protein|nr:hypothetical protein [Roseibacillus sp.]|tara:strand:- start:2750 stop:3127 length:378 start_codon:yes stop_codon:yes gene_type:complete